MIFFVLEVMQADFFNFSKLVCVLVDGDEFKLV